MSSNHFLRGCCMRFFEMVSVEKLAMIQDAFTV